QSAAQCRPRGRITWHLFYSMVKQHGCTKKSLQQSVMHVLRDARRFSATFFQTDILFAPALPLTNREPSLKRSSAPPAVPCGDRSVGTRLGGASGGGGAHAGKRVTNQQTMTGRHRFLLFSASYTL